MPSRYLVMTACIELQGGVFDFPNEIVQQGAGQAMGKVLQQIARTEESGQPWGGHPAGTPWEIASHTLTLMGRQLVVTALIRFHPS